VGLNDEAEAVEVAAGITLSQTHTEPLSTKSGSISEDIQVPPEPQPIIEAEMPLEKMSEVVSEVENPKDLETSQKDTYPNAMMMASSTLQDSCSVCRREIKSGDSFIYCMNCGKPGHYGHLGEVIKVTGKCPVCQKRLTPTMYDI